MKRTLAIWAVLIPLGSVPIAVFLDGSAAMACGFVMGCVIGVLFPLRPPT